jgi:hypothetical protein
MRRTSYDVEAACAAIREQSDYRDVAEWAGHFLHSRASDADALAAFAPATATPGDHGRPRPAPYDLVRTVPE